MPAYYNEFKPEAAHMLRQLIRYGLIAAGDVDERSITEVKANDLKSYTQCHFFAGIGGWSVALRLAGWDDDRPVWTGSCPCQPFSSAGKQKGKNDERHLWPVWFRLIAECRPAIIFGEQVAAAITHGWWDDVANDLESEGYEVEIMSGAILKRTITGLTSPTTIYTAAQQTTDFGSNQISVSVRVYQLSAMVGRGYAGVATI